MQKYKVEIINDQLYINGERKLVSRNITGEFSILLRKVNKRIFAGWVSNENYYEVMGATLVGKIGSIKFYAGAVNSSSDWKETPIDPDYIVLVDGSNQSVNNTESTSETEEQIRLDTKERKEWFNKIMGGI